jgi:hypothetical protein
MGAAIGVLTSLFPLRLSEARRDRVARLSQDTATRQKLCKQFIDEASELYADAFVHNEAKLSALVSVTH